MPGIAIRDISRLRRAAGAAALVAALTAMVPAAPVSAQSLTGDFLAARYAESTGDIHAAARYFQRLHAVDPSSDAFAGSAMIFSAIAGDVLAAAPIAATLAERQPTNGVANLIVSVEMLRTGEHAAAAARLSEENNGVTPLIGGMLRAWARFGAGERDAAEAELRSLNDNSVYELFSYHHLGLMALLAGDGDAAVAAFERALALNGTGSQRIAQQLGLAFEAAGRPDSAAALYERMLADGGDREVFGPALRRVVRGETAEPTISTPAEGAAEALYSLAAALGSGRDDGVRNAFVYAQLALYLDPTLDEARLLVGSAFADLGRNAAAVAVFEQVPVDSPFFTRAESNRATALTQLGLSDEALEALSRLVDRSPSPSRIHFSMADVYRRDARYGECVTAFDDGFARLEQPASWPVHFYRGVCYERDGQWDLAEAAFMAALELSPDEPEVLNYLGYSLIDRGSRLVEALEMIERAVERKPDAGHIVDSLGWAHYRLGDYGRAVRHLEKAVELEPVEPVINDHLGDALWKVGRRMEARFQWSRALSFDPTDTDRARIERKLAVGLDTVLREEAEASGDAVRDAANGEVGDDRRGG